MLIAGERGRRIICIKSDQNTLTVHGFQTDSEMFDSGPKKDAIVKSTSKQIEWHKFQLPSTVR